MFTGIITDIGKIIEIEDASHRIFKISCSYSISEIELGSSISCSGICLTVIDKGINKNRNFFSVEVSNETDEKTSSKFWKEGNKINLEKSLKIGDEVGGHFVYGHVDCLAQISSIKEDKNSNIFTIKYPKEFKGYITKKGSISLDGISLTINDVYEDEETYFTVNIIPHTREFTTWSDISINSYVNLEVDPIARYVFESIKN
tara:strand:+ start:8523 stop:9128 length:606 start_codon:yes stop_codon:yes gene_type:complete